MDQIYKQLNELADELDASGHHGFGSRQLSDGSIVQFYSDKWDDSTWELHAAGVYYDLLNQENDWEELNIEAKRTDNWNPQRGLKSRWPKHQTLGSKVNNIICDYRSRQ